MVVMTKNIDEQKFDIQFFDKDYKCAYSGRRDCFEDIMNYVMDNSPFQTKICAIYGLRRTGKTTLMEQCIEALSDEDKEKSILITCGKQTEFWKLYNKLEELIEKGYKFFFIDEITYANGFQETGESLANILVKYKNARIVITGTDSLGIVLPTYNLQYDRTFMVHTTYISFAEYSRLTGINNIDVYIEQGAVIEPDLLSDYKKIHNYINASISDNLINSLEKSEGIERYPAQLSELYEHDELKNAIERIINKHSQGLIAKAIKKEFETGVIKTELENISRSNDNPDNIRAVLNYEKLNDDIAQALGIVKNEELSVRITDAHKVAIYDLLKEMDVFVSVPVLKSYIDNESGRNLEMITQPAICYSNIERSMKALCDNDNWLENAAKGLRDRLIRVLYTSAYRELKKNIVISDVYQMLSNGQDVEVTDLVKNSGRWYVSKLRQSINGKDYEADLLVFDKERKETYIFDVDYSSEHVQEQCLTLESDDFCKFIEDNFGRIAGKVILYDGDTILEHKTPRVSISRFLKTLYKCKNEPIITFKDILDRVYDKGFSEDLNDEVVHGEGEKHS